MKELKPFDLEAAKRGEPICYADDRMPCFFVGVTRDGEIVVESVKWRLCTEPADRSSLRMAPKKRTVWVNIYPDGKAFWFDEPVESSSRIIATAVPVEIEE